MQVAVVVLPGSRSFDIVTAGELFADDRSDRGVPRNEVRVVGPVRTVQLDHGVQLTVEPLDRVRSAELVLVPGLRDVRAAVDHFEDSPAREVLHALRAAAARPGVQLASLCTGAFLLAATGLLDGGPATTHWRYCALLAERHPQIDVRDNVLWTHAPGSGLWTSAGVSAGVDLGLAILAEQHGAAAAAQVAASMVVAAVRPGGQQQFAPAHHTAAEVVGGEHDALRATMLRGLDRRWTLQDMASRAGVSPRTLQRRFLAEVGSTPAHWLQVHRLRAARELLESSTLSIEQIATRCGFGGADLLRKHFRAELGISPVRYRSQFRTDSTPGAGG